MDDLIKIELVDKEGKVIGEKEKFAIHRNPVPLHRAISVLVFNGDQVLLQKRAQFKPVWPGYWSNTCCTHPLPGENYQKAAERRLKKEMGFSVPLREKLRFIYQAQYDAVSGEHEYDVVFVGDYAGPVKADPNEVADYKWVKWDDLQKDLKKNHQKYTPWFKMIVEKLKI